MLFELLRVNAFGRILFQVETRNDGFYFELSIFSKGINVDGVKSISAADDHELFDARWRGPRIGDADFNISGRFDSRRLIQLSG